MLNQCPPANLVLLRVSPVNEQQELLEAKQLGYPFVFIFVFESQSLFVTLSGQELTISIKLAFNSVIHLPPPFCLFFRQNVDQWVKTRVLDGARDCLQVLTWAGCQSGHRCSRKGSALMSVIHVDMQ